MLTIYLLDLGLNHVMKFSSDEVPNSAHMLISSIYKWNINKIYIYIISKRN